MTTNAKWWRVQRECGEDRENLEIKCLGLLLAPNHHEAFRVCQPTGYNVRLLARIDILPDAWHFYHKEHSPDGFTDRLRVTFVEDINPEDKPDGWQLEREIFREIHSRSADLSVGTEAAVNALHETFQSQVTRSLAVTTNEEIDRAFGLFRKLCVCLKGIANDYRREADNLRREWETKAESSKEGNHDI